MGGKGVCQIIEIKICHIILLCNEFNITILQ